MTTRPSAQMRRDVFDRANGCCEYCLTHQSLSVATHQIDHVIAEKHGGETEIENLAVSCITCNLRKASDIASLDPETGDLVHLFNPRQQRWETEFRLDGACIVGITSIGRTTVTFLQLNTEARIVERTAFIAAGVYPPDLEFRKPR